jgi:hypothetical protein
MRYKLTFFIEAMILSTLFSVQTISAQMAASKEPARKIDRKKMNRNCTGNFLAGAPNADGSIPGAWKISRRFTITMSCERRR